MNPWILQRRDVNASDRIDRYSQWIFKLSERSWPAIPTCVVSAGTSDGGDDARSVYFAYPMIASISDHKSIVAIDCNRPRIGQRCLGSWPAIGIVTVAAVPSDGGNQAILIQATNAAIYSICNQQSIMRVDRNAIRRV
jgi:hypothetical protein